MNLFGSRPHEWTRALVGAVSGALAGPWWLIAQASPVAGAVAFVVGGTLGGYLGRRIGKNLGELKPGRGWRDWAREGLLIGAIAGLATGALGGALAAILSGSSSIELWFFQILQQMLQSWLVTVGGGLVLGALTSIGVGRLYHKRYFEITILNEPDPELTEGTVAESIGDAEPIEEQIIIQQPSDS